MKRMRQSTLPGRTVRLLPVLLILIAMSVHIGCGTLLHPERRGQSRGQIDPAIAILNGLGLLLFIVPGVVAFAVDFSTGAIYLPPGASAEFGDEPRIIYMDPDKITPQSLAAVIKQHTGMTIALSDDSMRVMEIDQHNISAQLTLARR